MKATKVIPDFFDVHCMVSSFGRCPLTLRILTLSTYGATNHSPPNQPFRLQLVAPQVYRDEFLKVNGLSDSNQIFKNEFVFIYYHLCKVSSQIIYCIIFAPYELSLTTIYSKEKIYSMVKSSVLPFFPNFNRLLSSPNNQLISFTFFKVPQFRCCVGGIRRTQDRRCYMAGVTIQM